MKTLLKITYLVLIISVCANMVAAQEQYNYNSGDSCEAFFIPVPNPSEQYTIQFADQSTGMINNWSWSFGDGTASSDQNPVHSFEGPGAYMVCLTISNNDSLNYCFDVFCDTVFLTDTIQCIADFSYVLDSNSYKPNKFQFNDASTGEIDFWYWDFGDGSFSSEQNPQHTFNQEGQYNVCLIVAQSNIINCVDTICYQIRMPDYFSFGGFAFTHDHPINNPFPTGDTGVALLYKLYSDNHLVPLDTNTFVDFGYYHFPNKLPGEYLVKIMLTPKSTHFKSYMATYYQDNHFWNQAQSVFISDSNAYNMHVYLKEIPGVEPGPGTIRGQIVEDRYSPFERPYPTFSTEIILATTDGQPLDFTYCNQDGKFHFNNISFGSYKLFVDHTGKYALPVIVEINETVPIIDTILIKISDHSLTAIGESSLMTLIEVGNVYPNPVRDMLNLEINALGTMNVNIRVLDIHGRKNLEYDQTLQQGENKLHLSSASLPRGVYLLMLRFEGEKYIISRKFIK